MLLSMAERRLGVAERLARCIPDRRDPLAYVHADMIRARVFAICCGYQDADDLDVLPAIRRLSSPADGCPTAGATCVRSRPCGGSKTHRG